MKALILVGGEGTRLRPLTYNTPKSMVPVLNVPFLEHVIRNLREHNITEIIMAQHHLPESMKEYFGDGSRFGVKIQHVMEDFPRGSAGAVKNAQAYLTETFVVLNGDIFHNRDFTAMLAFHRNAGAKVTIDLAPVEDPTAFGMVETDETGRVKRFVEKPKPEEVTSNLINAGTWIIEPEVLKMVPCDVKCSFEREIFPLMLAAEQPVYAFPSHRYWLDAGTPARYLQLHRDLLANKCEGYEFKTDVITGDGCDIHPSVKFSGRVIIGDGCVISRDAKLTGPVVIGPGCRICEEAAVTDSVIWNNVTAGQRAVIKGSIVSNDCNLGDDSCLTDAVLGDNVTVSPGYSPKPGSHIMPGDVLKGS